MRLGRSPLTFGLVLAFMPLGMVAAPSASADCTNAGSATVCAQGDVRGGGPTPPSAYYPSYCADPWYCDNGWDIDVVRPIHPGRPGWPIGPRR
jgi:hypothetical protein